MVLRHFDPHLDEKTEYIFYSHEKPWRLSCGDIVRIYIDEGVIYVDFTLSLSDATDSDKWDPKRELVILEVIDNDDKIVFQTPVKIEKKFVEGRIGLRS